MKNQNKIIGALDIGTSKIIVLIAEISNGTDLNILGMGEASTHGVNKGDIVDMEATSNCVYAAINTVEKSAGTSFEKLYMSLTGGHIRGFYNKGIVGVSSPDNIIVEEDVKRATESARVKELRPDRVYIHHILNGYKLDGKNIEFPLGKEGEQLEASYLHITSDEKKLADQIHILNWMHYTVDDVILSSLASGCTLVTELEKINGSLVIDIGAGITDYVLYLNGKIAKTGVIKVGGNHITSDLGMALRINTQRAEEIKCQYNKLADDENLENRHLWLYGDRSIGDRPVQVNAIDQIIEARLDELFNIIKNELGTSFKPNETVTKITLTGGTSRQAGITNIAKNVFEMDVSLGEIPNWVQKELRHPEYSTVLGILLFALKYQKNDIVSKKKKSRFKILSRLFSSSK